MVTYTLKVIALKPETTDAITISFKQPALKKVKYKPGQYMTLTVNINNRKYKRPYSLSSAPGIDNTLNITVKRLLHGIVSNHLIDILKVEDMVEIMEPMGDFVYQSELHSSKDIFLWGAGSGITPLMSIIKAALAENAPNINLFYCNKNLEHTIFYNELIELKEQYPDKFSLALFCTEDDQPGVTHGRINEQHVTGAIANVNDVKNTIHYICGPVGLKDTVKKVLLNAGLTKNEIFSEDFEHIVNEAELTNVQTRIVNIVKKDQKSKIEVVRGKSILEAGLDIGLDLPYSCQTGTCTLCKARLVSGDVKKIDKLALDHPILNDERLLCCSYPLTDNVVFEIE